MSAHTPHRSGEKRREEAILAVMELAAQDKPDQITTGRIARHMGLSQAALFRHFPSKESVWEAVMQWVADKLLERLDRAAAEAGTPLDRLQAMFLAHVRFVVRHPGVPRILFAELQHDRDTAPKRIARTLLQNYRQRILQHLRQAEAQGLLRQHADLDAAAVLFIGMLQGLVMQSLLQQDFQAMETMAPRLFDTYLRALEVSP